MLHPHNAKASLSSAKLVLDAAPQHHCPKGTGKGDLSAAGKQKSLQIKFTSVI
jgi:hypothetical protein